MLLRNIGRIVEEGLASLVHESWGEGNLARAYVATVFGLIPLVIGIFLGIRSTIWVDLMGALIPVLGVLTGFSINAIVLLTGHSEVDSYELKTKVVNQTIDFTLYSLLVGIVVLATLTIGFITVMSNPIPAGLLPFTSPISDVQFVSILIYTLLTHYLLLLFVITHRLYTLVHSNAIQNG